MCLYTTGVPSNAMVLQGQEAQYNAKVDAVKAEHDKLVQDAFERAKAS